MQSPREILERYERLALHDANEAETRLKVIDHILFGLLGWTHDDIHVEDRIAEDGKTSFADYVIRTGMTALVIEAKRAGETFHDVPNLRRIPLRGKYVEGPTGEAIRQARDYARRMGIPFAAATNGSQWIIFPASRVDQVSFEQSSAIVFPDLRSVLQEDVADFLGLLSRDAVIGGSLQNELLGRIEDQFEERRLNRFYTTPFSRIHRSNLFHLIEDAVVTAFTENTFEGDVDLLEKCYVKTPERIRFDRRIRMHIAKRRSVLKKRAPRPMKAKDESALVDVIAAASRRTRPVAVLLVGLVGAGKTTFLNYTRWVAARELFEEHSGQPRPHWIYVDFRSLAPEGSAIDHLYSEMKRHIQADNFLSSYERCVKHAYREEIDALLKGPLFLLANDEAERKRRITDLLMAEYEATTPYVNKILAYAAGNAPVFLVIDNVDQFEYQEKQAEVFADAMAVAHSLKLNLVLALRDATYVRHRTQPIFDAFDFDPIYVDPPRVAAVLSRRFFIARQTLKDHSVTFTAENGATVHLSDSSIIIDMIQESVLGTEVGNLLDVVATSDIRLALRMTREFLQYGYTATGKALHVYQSTGKYILPRHEAVRAIMLGNQSVYSDEYSVLGNPFDAKLGKTKAQLLRVYILVALVNFNSHSGFQQLDGEDIKQNLRTIGFGDDLTLTVLEDLCRHRFVFTGSHTVPTLRASFLPSRLGGYVVRVLIGELAFLENVMMDTFIADEQVWRRLRELTDQVYAERDIVKKLQIRKTRAEAFFRAMKNMYEPLREESARRGLPAEWCGHPLEAIEGQFRENLKYALRSANRQQAARASADAAVSG